MEQYIVDIILAAIFVAFTVVFFVRGFAKTVLSSLTFIGAIICSKIFAADVTEWVLKNTKFFSDTEVHIAKLIITVIMFLLILFVLRIIVEIIDKLFKIPVLKQANQLLGGIFGAVSGAIIVFILAICLQISSHMVYNAKYIDTVRNSVIVQTILPEESVSGGAVRENGGK